MVLDLTPARARAGRRRGRKGRRSRTLERTRSDVEPRAGTGEAGRAGGLLGMEFFDPPSSYKRVGIKESEKEGSARAEGNISAV